MTRNEPRCQFWIFETNMEYGSAYFKEAKFEESLSTVFNLQVTLKSFHKENLALIFFLRMYEKYIILDRAFLWATASTLRPRPIFHIQFAAYQKSKMVRIASHKKCWGLFPKWTDPESSFIPSRSGDCMSPHRHIQFAACAGRKLVRVARGTVVSFIEEYGWITFQFSEANWWIDRFFCMYLSFPPDETLNTFPQIKFYR